MAGLNGICQSQADCQIRAAGNYGSSKGYAMTMPAPGGILASDASNPDFASWNRIYVPYCSGDVWVGNMYQILQ